MLWKAAVIAMGLIGYGVAACVATNAHG